eukprot:m.131637 g.131637  ORF g.131637 m.131637 type:complete len:409 (-) comp14630_c0_seq4:1086-2312(-)
MACGRYMPNTVGYGQACAVCGYPESQHSQIEADNQEESRIWDDLPPTTKTDKTATLNESKTKRRADMRTTVQKHVPRTSRRKASNTKEEKTKQKSEKLSELAKTRAAQQANMLSQAADMARGEGDMQEAKKLYEKSADLFGTLCLADTKAIPLGLLTKTLRDNNENVPDSTRSDISTASIKSYRSDWSHAQSSRSEITNTRSRGQSTAEKKWLRATQQRNPDKTMNRSNSNEEATIMELLREAQFDDAIRGELRGLFRKYSEGAPSLSPAQLSQLLRDFKCYGPPQAYFMAMDRSKNKTWISVKDFELGIAALDPLTPHAGGWRSERARQIFRFYNSGRREMDLSTLAAMIEDLQAVAGTHRSNEAVHIASQLIAGKRLNEDKFIALVEQDKLRGMSSLFRFSLIEKL